MKPQFGIRYTRAMTSSFPFIAACRGEATTHTPFWLNRQAGRYMPEYHRLKGKLTSKEFFLHPEPAAEMTLTAQKMLGVDAAILFTDLLPVLELLGLELDYQPGTGPVFSNPLRQRKDIESMHGYEMQRDMACISECIGLILADLPKDIALIGFAGAPFTLASYAVEGRGGGNKETVKRMMHDAPDLWDKLMSTLVELVSDFVDLQVRAGVHAVQLFDSWVGALGVNDYRRFVAPWTKKLIDSIRTRAGPEVPIILFGVGNGHLLKDMLGAGPDVMALDWQVPLGETWQALGCRAVQGNLDPAILFCEESVIEAEALRILDEAAGRPGHIFNLGHGILPETEQDKVRFLVDRVHEAGRRTAD